MLLAKCFHEKLVLPETLETTPRSEVITQIGSLLLLHTRQLKTNSHAITEVKSSATGKAMSGTVQETSQIRVATAVYPTASLLNHACEPNVTVG